MLSVGDGEIPDVEDIVLIIWQAVEPAVKVAIASHLWTAGVKPLFPFRRDRYRAVASPTV